jgi:hypothetical protein
MRMVGPGEVIAGTKLEAPSMIADINPRQNCRFCQILKISKHSYAVEASSLQSMCDLGVAERTPLARECPEDGEARSGGAQPSTPKQVADLAQLCVIRVRGIIEFGRIICLRALHDQVY